MNELIQFEGKGLAGVRDQLEKVQEERKKEAITALVMKRTPLDVISQRPIRGGRKADYVPTWWFVDQANALFGHNWTFEIVEQGVGERQVWVKGKLVIRTPERMEKETRTDGTVVEVRQGGLEIVKMQYGGHDLAKDDKGNTISIGDTLKAAASDSLKKCFTMLGIAADIYGDREELERRQIEAELTRHLKMLYDAGREGGMEDVEVDALVASKLGMSPGEMDNVSDLVSAISVVKRAVAAGREQRDETTA